MTEEQEMRNLDPPVKDPLAKLVADFKPDDVFKNEGDVVDYVLVGVAEEDDVDDDYDLV